MVKIVDQSEHDKCHHMGQRAHQSSKPTNLEVEPHAKGARLHMSTPQPKLRLVGDHAWLADQGGRQSVHGPHRLNLAMWQPPIGPLSRFFKAHLQNSLVHPLVPIYKYERG